MQSRRAGWAWPAIVCDILCVLCDLCVQSVAVGFAFQFWQFWQFWHFKLPNYQLTHLPNSLTTRCSDLSLHRPPNSPDLGLILAGQVLHQVIGGAILKQ